MTDDASSWEDRLIADLRAHGGRPSGGPLAGHPLLILYSTGSRSGARRRAILTYSRDGGAFVVAGTNNARATDPAWIGNVRADPRVSLEIANRTVEATARIVEGPERDLLWRQHVAQLPWFSRYEREIASRTIPMVRLEPLDPASDAPVV